MNLRRVAIALELNILLGFFKVKLSRMSSMDCIGTGRRKKRPESILNLAQGGHSGNPVWRIFVEWTIRKTRAWAMAEPESPEMLSVVPSEASDKT